MRIALLDLSHGDAPRLAQRDGETPIYPASVVKFVYSDGRLRVAGRREAAIDAEMDGLLTR